MSNLTLRAATGEDTADLLVMMADFNHGEGIAFDSRKFGPAVLKLIGNDSLGLLPLFLAGAEIAGYAVLTWGYDLEFGGRDSFLTEFFLRPPFRGAGRGRAALSLVESLARERGAHALHLGVRPDNEPALRLYSGAGYADWTRKFMTKLL